MPHFKGKGHSSKTFFRLIDHCVLENFYVSETQDAGVAKLHRETVKIVACVQTSPISFVARGKGHFFVNFFMHSLK